MKKSCAYLKKKHWGRKSSKWKKKQRTESMIPTCHSQEASKTKTSPISFRKRLDYNFDRVQYSNLTLKWKGTAPGPYCISVWVGKKATLYPGECFPVSRHTAWRLEGGMNFRSPFPQPGVLMQDTTCIALCKNTDFPASWNNFSFDRKRSSLFLIIYILMKE